MFDILDCTLRDGGYCNNWDFGDEKIMSIINSLSASGVKWIECGYFVNNRNHLGGSTKFSNLIEIEKYFNKSLHSKYLGMINYGEFPVEKITKKGNNLLDGIRVSFHKKDSKKVDKLCWTIKNSGYLLFLQPMITNIYDENEFIELLEWANRVEPYAFYIVDSFGSMTCEQVRYYFEIANDLLKRNIKIGFHAHNNMSLAMTNALLFISLSKQKDRKCIIDSSLYGMGRAAGNLAIEQIINITHCGNERKTKLNILLKEIEKSIYPFYLQTPWGNHIYYYIAAILNIHPFYAKYIIEKDNCTFEQAIEILTAFRSRTYYDEQSIAMKFEQIQKQ